MSHERRIQDLEEAVLHLSRAVNRMIESHEMESSSRERDEGRMTSRQSDRFFNGHVSIPRSVVRDVQREDSGDLCNFFLCRLLDQGVRCGKVGGEFLKVVVHRNFLNLIRLLAFLCL